MKTLSLFAVVLSCLLVLPAYAFSDDFDDGVINTALWDASGSRGGYGGCGNGPGQWFNQEIAAADGYLQARATTPVSPGGWTYGAQAWIRTQHNFNDGQDYLVNFKWEADIQTVGTSTVTVSS